MQFAHVPRFKNGFRAEAKRGASPSTSPGCQSYLALRNEKAATRLSKGDRSRRCLSNSDRYIVGLGNFGKQARLQ